MKRVSLTGSTDERFSHIETILTRIIAQVPKTITCQVPPVPLSFYSPVVPEDRVVLRFIFPVKGVLKRAAIMVDEWKENKSVLFEATAHNAKGSTSQVFSTKTKSEILKLDLPVEAGMALTVKCQQDVEGIWIGLLYQVHVNQAETMQLALDQMEAINARIYDTL